MSTSTLPILGSEPMAQSEDGKLRYFQALSGSLLGKVSFYLGNGHDTHGFGNDIAAPRVGKQTVFSWLFPEAATVPKELGDTGDSHAAMGTAPDVWNAMLGVLVSIVPRPWWRSERFSQFLADFSQPLVKAADILLKATSSNKMGETHAMRIDVTGAENGEVLSIVQGHESFRRCVGQSCAEFAMDVVNILLLESPCRNNAIATMMRGNRLSSVLRQFQEPLPILDLTLLVVRQRTAISQEWHRQTWRKH
jgi:hypothetical protein